MAFKISSKQMQSNVTGKPHTKQNQYYFSSNGKQHILQYTEEEKDIGVIIDKLEFDKHINEKINKATRTMAIIRRSFLCLNESNFNFLYKALVRSHLDYAAAVWSPYKQKHIEAIENVQRRATKQLPGFRDLCYSDRLKKLQLPTLSYRRHRGDMIEVYKIVHSIYDNEIPSMLQLYADHSQRSDTRGHTFKLYQRRCITNLRKYNFSMRVVNTWNDLPEYVISAPSVNTFKNRLDECWKNQEIKYNYKGDVTKKLNCIPMHAQNSVNLKQGHELTIEV